MNAPIPARWKNPPIMTLSEIIQKYIPYSVYPVFIFSWILCNLFIFSLFNIFSSLFVFYIIMFIADIYRIPYFIYFYCFSFYFLFADVAPFFVSHHNHLWIFWIGLAWIHKCRQCGLAAALHYLYLVFGITRCYIMYPMCLRLYLKLGLAKPCEAALGLPGLWFQGLLGL